MSIGELYETVRASMRRLRLRVGLFLNTGVNDRRIAYRAEAESGTNGKGGCQGSSCEHGLRANKVSGSREHDCFGDYFGPNPKNGMSTFVPGAAELVSEDRTYFIAIMGDQVVTLK